MPWTGYKFLLFTFNVLQKCPASLRLALEAAIGVRACRLTVI
jgi:hypothetical protein